MGRLCSVFPCIRLATTLFLLLIDGNSANLRIGSCVQGKYILQGLDEAAQPPLQYHILFQPSMYAILVVIDLYLEAQLLLHHLRLGIDGCIIIDGENRHGALTSSHNDALSWQRTISVVAGVFTSWCQSKEVIVGDNK
jgi:hypothetical protein